MSYDLYRTSSIHENSTVNTNPSLALPGFYAERPALDYDYVEKPLPDILGTYSPKKEDTPVPPFEAPSSIRTNPELAALVAKIIEEDRLEERQTIEKVVIQMGTKSLQLLEAANSL